MAFLPSIRISESEDNPLNKIYPKIDASGEDTLIDIEKINFPNNALDFQENLLTEALLNHIRTIGIKILGPVFYSRGEITIKSGAQGSQYFDIDVSEFYLPPFKFRVAKKEDQQLGSSDSSSIYVYITITIDLVEGDVPNFNERGEIVYGAAIKGANYRVYKCEYDISETLLPESQGFDDEVYPKKINLLYAILTKPSSGSQTGINVRYLYDKVPLYESSTQTNNESRTEGIRNLSSIELLSKLVYQMSYFSEFIEIYNATLHPGSIVFSKGINFIVMGKSSHPIKVELSDKFYTLNIPLNNDILYLNYDETTNNDQNA